VTVGVLLTDTSCNGAMYESDDLINNDSGDGWVTGDHNAIWTLPSGTYLAITDAASCTYPTDREPGPDDQGNLLATVSVTPSG
jgi:hypothetical protein